MKGEVINFEFDKPGLYGRPLSCRFVLLHLSILK